MKVCALALLATFILLAADKRQAATALKAQSDFERVESVSRPRIPDAEVCMQSQAAALSVSSPEERSLLFYRKGYCNFAGAAASEAPPPGAGVRGPARICRHRPLARRDRRCGCRGAPGNSRRTGIAVV